MPDPYVTKAQVYVMGRQTVVSEELARFLQDEGLAFTTDTQADLTPPVISDVTAIPADSSVIVRWTTDEPGDSYVAFALPVDR